MNTPARPINELEGFEDFMSESDEGTTEPIFVKKRGEKNRESRMAILLQTCNTR